MYWEFEIERCSGDGDRVWASLGAPGSPWITKKGNNEEARRQRRIANCVKISGQDKMGERVNDIPEMAGVRGWISGGSSCEEG